MCFLIPALVGLLCALLGYLLGKMSSGSANLDYKSKLDSCHSEKEKLNNQLYAIEKELSDFKNKAVITNEDSKLGLVTTTTKEKKPIATEKNKVESNKKVFKENKISKSGTYDAKAVAAVFGKKYKIDDLKIVEGIGPKIAELYHAEGIKTWKKLSETPVTKSQAILDAAGSRYTIHNPETWAKQAGLAYEGKWEELKTYQDSLNGGRK